MGSRHPPRGGAIPGGDWSTALNTDSSLAQATVLAHLGRELRNLYAGLIGDEVPEHLAEFVRKLEHLPRNDERA
jgi:hypothetical protein